MSPDDDVRSASVQPRTLQRIVNVDYVMPSSISAQAADLLNQLLVGDPSARLSLEQIVDHPWFQVDLPAGVMQMNDALPQQRSGLQVGCLLGGKHGGRSADGFWNTSLDLCAC